MEARMERGFTLVEMLIVVALVALISVFALPSLTRVFRVSADSSVRRMAAIIKETYQAAVVSGRVHRLVYDLKNRAYWVEEGPSTFLLDTDRSREIEENRTTLVERKEKAEEQPSEFRMAGSITRSKINLPDEVAFEDIMTEATPEPVTEGTAYTHFFPHGLTERTLIHIRDGSSKREYSVIISSLIGQTRLVNERVSKEEAFGK